MYRYNLRWKKKILDDMIFSMVLGRDQSFTHKWELSPWRTWATVLSVHIDRPPIVYNSGYPWLLNLLRNHLAIVVEVFFFSCHPLISQRADSWAFSLTRFLVFPNHLNRQKFLNATIIAMEVFQNLFSPDIPFFFLLNRAEIHRKNFFPKKGS